MKHGKIVSFLTALLAVLMIASVLPAGALAAAHRHTWGEWQVTREPTCWREGEEVRKCSGCGATEERPLRKLEHKFGEWTVTKEPTCTESGTHERVCKVCGHVRVREVEKLPHDWTAWKVTTPATEFSKGVRMRTCRACGLEEIEEFYPDPTYKKGDRGAGVKELQEKLNAAGYKCGTPGGKYGTTTEKAVKKLEKDHGFTEDGIAWPGVQKWLDGEYGWTPPADLEPEDEPEEPEGPEEPEEPETDEGPDLPEMPGEVSPASLQAEEDPSGVYGFTVEALEPDPHPGYGVEEFDVRFRITNTSLKQADIYFNFALGMADKDNKPVSWDVAYETDTYGHWHFVHEPGQTSTMTIRFKLIDMDVEKERVERTLWFMLLGSGELPDGYPVVVNLNYKLSIDFPDPAIEIEKAALASNVNMLWRHAGVSMDVVNTGGRRLYAPTLRLYYWDKAAGAYVFDGNLNPWSSGGYFGVNGHRSYNEVMAYFVTEKDLDNAEDGVARIAYKAFAETKDGTPVESEFAELEFNVCHVELFLEAEDTSAGLTPADGKVTLKVWLTNDGTETMSIDGKDSFLCWNDWLPATEEHFWFHHGEGLFFFTPGSTEEMDLELKVFEEDVQAGEIRRNLWLGMRRLEREGGKRVYPDTPAGEVAGMGAWFGSNNVELVIPLPQESAEEEPAPKAPERCSPRFVAAGDGSAERAVSECPEHSAVAKAAAKLVADAEGTEDEAAAWEAAPKLWEDALDKEYDAAVKAAKGAWKKALQAEREAFETLLAARKAALALEYPDDPAAAAQEVAELLEHKTCLVCYERHTTPDAGRLLRGGAEGTLSKAGASGNCAAATHRAGSTVYETETLCAAHAAIDASAAEADGAEAWKQVKDLWIAELNRIADEKYLRADEAGRAAIAAERVAYGEWLKAREAMLTVLYPGQEAAVQALLAEAVRARVIGLCETGFAG